MYYLKLEGKLNSYMKFKAQSRRIKRLYLVSLYAYEGALSNLNRELKSNKIDMSTDMYFQDNLVARSPNEMRKNLDDKYPIVLRESLFVRQISLLEIFLGDTLKELSNSTTKPFMSKNEKKYKISHILSLDNIKELQDKIIDEEIRSKISQGFSNIKKFYLYNLKIDFSKAGINLNTLQQLHDIRHLLVHNNGKTDEYYRHKYNISEKYIEIKEEFFLENFRLLSDFADYIYKAVNDTFELPPRKLKKEKNDRKLNEVRKYRIEFPNAKYMAQCLDITSEFGFDEKYKLSAILKNIEYISDLEVIISVEGDRKILGIYGGFIKKLEKNEFIDFYKRE